LAKHIPQSKIIATDISDAALEVAKENAKKYKVDDEIDFFAHDMIKGFDSKNSPLAGKQLQYLISNPPYISDREWQEVEQNVKGYEPASALRGGADGLDFIRILIEQAPDYLAKNGQLVLEIAASQ